MVLDQQDFVDTQADFSGGLTNTFRWKGLECSFFLNFVKQNGFDFIGRPGDFGNQPRMVLERWQQPGDITRVPRASRRGLPFGVPGAARLTDASFIRLQNVSISWTLPEEFVSKIGIENARISLNGQNLLTITNFKGMDPETGITALPPLRMITTGIQLTF